MFRSTCRPDFGAKALAMEKAAVSAGVGGKLKYACPWQCLESLETIAASGVGNLGPRVVFDLHTSTPGVDSETGVMAGTPLDSPQAGTYGLSTAVAQLKAAGLGASRVGWWETNTGRLHDMSRAIMEALDRNELDRSAAGYHLDTRTASFCTEYSGHDDLWTVERGDQGLIFFSANQTWGQPPAHLHAAMAASAQPHALAVANDLNGTSPHNTYVPVHVAYIRICNIHRRFAYTFTYIRCNTCIVRSRYIGCRGSGERRRAQGLSAVIFRLHGHFYRHSANTEKIAHCGR